MSVSGRQILFYTSIVAGDCMVVAMFAMLSVQPPALAAPKTSVVMAKANAVPAVVGEPVRLSIDILTLSWPVARGSFDPNTDSWTDSGDQAIFAEASLQPNDSNGVTLMYGHARSTVFMNLNQLKPGDTATVVTLNGYVFTYKFDSLIVVAPTNISVFTELGPPTLVLQTCSGPWDSYRALYNFSFVSVAKG